MKNKARFPKLRISVLIPAILFFIWAVINFWLFFSDQYLTYLQPKFRVLVLFSAIVFVLFAVCLLAGKKHSPHHQVGLFLPGLILLLPMFFMFGSVDKTLGSNAYTKRVLNATAGQPSNSDEAQNNPISVEELFPEPQFDQLNASYDYLPISISKLLKQSYQYNKYPVEIKGKIYNRKDVTWANAVVYRFYITCCAADAQTVGVFIKDMGTKQFENDVWVQVKGMYYVTKINNNYKGFIFPHSIKSIAEPPLAQQYLYFPN
ncbi:MAG: TIGR03943 family protein [Proteobacteria bacterium]|nr:TIGR03943 family protein [Pseudomonadota bacterium]